MTIQVVPGADGGSGPYTWDRNPRISSAYRIRSARGIDALVTLSDHVTNPDAVLDGFCRVLHDTQGGE